MNIVGIDEAGRGPLAGPVAVGVAVVPGNFDWASKLPDVTDSKQLSEAKREEVFRAARRLKAAGQLDFAVAMVSAKIIDEKGIVPAINLAMKRALTRLQLNPKHVAIKLDGGLKAPVDFIHQETIVKGDQKEKIIGLASICAKVTRDRYMVRQGRKAEYAAYGLAVHKGYGTKMHRERIKQHGLSAEHRHSFCRNILSTKA